jgi:small subunit ribosomal protein S14
MAASMLGSLLGTFRQVVPSSTSGQVRGYYVDWRMLRDVKRRKMAYEYADERLRINSLRKNTILPKYLQVS